MLDAQRLAGEYNHSQIEPDHLLTALLRQADGVVPQVIARLGDVRTLLAEVETNLASRPKVYGASTQPGLSRAASDALNAAEREAKGMMEHLKQIVDIQLNRARKLLADRGLSLEVTDAAKAYLAREGWDPTYGARPLKRAIQRELQDPLALKILQGAFQEGDIVRVDVEADALTFTPVVQGEGVTA